MHVYLFIYEDYGLLASMWSEIIQREFNVLAELFYGVGLQTNVYKKASITCQPCCAIGGHPIEAYRFCMKGAVIMNMTRLHQRFCCPD